MKEDTIERPPLTGRSRLVPEGLYDQPWSKVSDAYGKATLTPYYIEALTSEDEDDVGFGVYGLYSATTHQGSVYKASQMAVPFLVDLLTHETAAGWACFFLSRIAFGEQHFIKTPADYFQTKYYKDVAAHLQKIEDYFERSHDETALRLLCLLGALPEYINITSEDSFDNTLKPAGDTNAEAIYRASSLLVQGFIASNRNFSGKGYPSCAADIDQGNLITADHCDDVKRLMQESRFPLVRGCAAACLVYTGVVEQDILNVLTEIGLLDIKDIEWSWDEDFSHIAAKAWLFAADMETLLNPDSLSAIDFPHVMPNGYLVKNSSPQDYLAEAVDRAFPPKFLKKEELPSLLPAELSDIQRKILQRILEAAPEMIGSYPVEYRNIPVTIPGVKRLLEESDEVLCETTEGIPLWFHLEQAAIQNMPDTANAALARADVFAALPEIYPPNAKSRWQCTLNIWHPADKISKTREPVLQSILANALAGYEKQCKSFLDEWLEESKDFEGHDWASKLPAQRVGICLLSLARINRLEEKYYPLVRPFHPYPQFSKFPISLLKEVLGHTSAEHIERTSKEYGI